MERFEISTFLPAPPEVVFHAWLDGATVAEFTGSPAEGDDLPGSAFTAWDGYITGENLEIDPPSHILQSWRTTEFPEGAPDSTVEISLEVQPKGTLLRLVHSGFPENQGEDYRSGWEDYYFAPLRSYFEK
jgi:uncharacterized protein YndB with AHSA1/START domain